MQDFISQNQDSIAMIALTLGPVALGAIIGVIGALREGSRPSVGFDRKEPKISFNSKHMEKDEKEPTFAKV